MMVQEHADFAPRIAEHATVLVQENVTRVTLDILKQLPARANPAIFQTVKRAILPDVHLANRDTI